jgi:alkylated DNA repair dioxygenase AlkB
MSANLIETGALWIEAEFLSDSQALFEHLLKTLAWDNSMQARKAVSFGLPYNYSGISYERTPLPEVLLPLVDRLEQRLGYRVNNCLVHYYVDGTNTMGFHSDATRDLVAGTGIAVVSLGAERNITFRSQSNKKVLESYPLRSGSLLFMTAEMQQHWKHAILQQENIGPRISLTFRCMRSP